VSFVATCAPCLEKVLKAGRIGDEEECILRDHLPAVYPNTTVEDAAGTCGHEGRDFYLEVQHKDGKWAEWPGFKAICEACARGNLKAKLTELLALVTRSESFREAWGSKSLPLRFRSRDGRIIDEAGTVN